LSKTRSAFSFKLGSILALTIADFAITYLLMYLG
jgi:hypothetical protein